MADLQRDVDGGPDPLWRVVKTILLGGGFVLALGAVAGFVVAMAEHDGRLSLPGGLVLAGLVALAGLLGWLLWRTARSWRVDAPASPRERRNRVVMLLCGLLGGVAAAVMMIGGGILPEGGLFAGTPLPAWAAIVLIALVGVLLPVAAWVWHRNVDEQESAAYRTGAIWGLYLYMIGAPVWWFGWRGGLLPAPDGTLIYFATVFTCGAVWLWQKYR